MIGGEAFQAEHRTLGQALLSQARTLAAKHSSAAQDERVILANGVLFMVSALFGGCDDQEQYMGVVSGLGAGLGEACAQQQPQAANVVFQQFMLSFNDRAAQVGADLAPAGRA